MWSIREEALCVAKLLVREVVWLLIGKWRRRPIDEARAVASVTEEFRSPASVRGVFGNLSLRSWIVCLTDSATAFFWLGGR